MLPFISHSHKFHHNYTNFPKTINFVDVSIYPCVDIELCHHCFALQCEFVPINIVYERRNR